MAEKNSDPRYRENKAAICADYNRLLWYLSAEQRARISAKQRHCIGITADFRPRCISYTGKLKPMTWFELDNIAGSCVRSQVAEQAPIAQVVGQCDIVSGYGILDVYADSRPGSCMSYEHCQEWLSLYVNNPGDVDAIVYSSGLTNNKECSWLRWKGNRTAFFGKLYAHADSTIMNIVRDRVSFRFGVKPGIPAPNTFRLKWAGQRLPYMDEYRYCKDYCESDGTITLSRDSGNDKHGDVRDHENGWHPTEDPEPRHACEGCGCAVDLEDSGYSLDEGIYCDDCVLYCEWHEQPLPADCVSLYTVYANGRVGDMWLSDGARDAEFTRSNCDRHGDVDYIEDCSVVTLSNGNDCSPEYDDLVYDVDGEPHDTDDCVQCVTDDETYHEDDDRICEVDGRWYLKTDDSVVVSVFGCWLVDAVCA